MTTVQQSGAPTPYHIAQWLANGVIGDGGAMPTGRLIVSGRGLNFNTTADQPIAIPQYITAFRIANIIITNASISLTTAQGGFYPAASKGGTPIVANSQAYSALTTSAGLMTAALAPFGSGTRFSAANLGTIGGLLAIWFSLSVAQGAAAAATADIYFVIDNLS
jgi:hypothetical protein